MPLIVLASYWWVPDESGTWEHLRRYVLADYVVNSLAILVGVAALVGPVGVTTAWLVAAYEFPWRRHFEWLLVLPLALPTYIIAFTYGGMLDEVGPVQKTLRGMMGWSIGDVSLPPIRSLGGVILVMSLVLYPYVYLICRAVIATQIQHLSDVSQIMGLRGASRFFRIVLPLVRPALVAGTGLALMEALGDFGSVSFFGVDTFTTGIYRAWFNLEDVGSAARLSTMLMLFIFVLILVERWSRKNLHVEVANQPVGIRRVRLEGWHRGATSALCGLLVMLGFVVPVGQLMWWAASRWQVVWGSEYLWMVGRTFGLAAGVAILIVAAALWVRFSQRLTKSMVVELLGRATGLGYAVPGSVLSVGIMVSLGQTGSWWNGVTQGWGWEGVVLTGTLGALSYAYAVRFFAVAYGGLDGGFARIPQQVDEAALCLGRKPWQLLGAVHVPLLKGSLLSAGALVWIDILKELPATIILRPFNFDTLATKTYELAKGELLPDASVYALSIVLVGVLPVMLLVRSMGGGKEGSE